MPELFKKIFIIAVLFLTAAAKTSAISFTNPLTGNAGSSGDPGLSELIDRILGFFFGLAIVICPLFILWGAFLIAVSAGDQEKTKKGREIITYAVVGFLLAGISGAIKWIILDIVNTP